MSLREQFTAVPYDDTCDQCAEGPKPCLLDPESSAYICEDCLSFHKRAIDHATLIVLHLVREGPSGTRELVEAAVKAYCEFTDEAAS